jgi:hypothetical protein
MLTLSNLFKYSEMFCVRTCYFMNKMKSKMRAKMTTEDVATDFKHPLVTTVKLCGHVWLSKETVLFSKNMPGKNVRTILYFRVKEIS